MLAAPREHWKSAAPDSKLYAASFILIFNFNAHYGIFISRASSTIFYDDKAFHFQLSKSERDARLLRFSICQLWSDKGVHVAMITFFSSTARQHDNIWKPYLGCSKHAHHLRLKFISRGIIFPQGIFWRYRFWYMFLDYFAFHFRERLWYALLYEKCNVTIIS